LQQLDVLRGIAILAVFLYHALLASFGFDGLPWAGLIPDFSAAPLSFYCVLPLSYGALGVAVFFVVSGFCIHLSHARSGVPSFKIFFVRRFFRIYPPYVGAVLLFALGSLWSNHPTSLTQFLSHVSLLHNLDEATFFGINPSFWSIAVEVQLYGLYPLLWFYARRNGWRQALRWTAAIELGIRSVIALHTFLDPTTALPQWATANPFTYWFSWSIGAALCEAHLAGTLAKIRPWSCTVLAGLILGVGLFRPITTFSFPLVALLTAAVIGLSITKHRAVNSRKSSLLTQIGTVSFSFYLLHQPLLNILTKVFRLWSGLNYPLVTLGFCCLCFWPLYGLAVLYYRTVELPSIAVGKFVLSKLYSPKPAASKAVVVTAGS
jgi:peptidoglycan/LPS O-acetylase OafA/YrhL